MLIVAIILFALAALLGMVLISYVVQNKPTPKGIAFIHGPLAALGILFLIIYSFYHATPWVSLILFILAACGGLYLIFRDLTGKTVPISVAAIHGLVAIIAFVLLLIFAF